MLYKTCLFSSFSFDKIPTITVDLACLADVISNIKKELTNLSNEFSKLALKNVLNLCLEELGYSKLGRSTKIPIEEYIENSLPESIDSEEVSLIIKLIVSTREFQMN